MITKVKKVSNKKMFPLTLSNLCSLETKNLEDPVLADIDKYPKLDLNVEYLFEPVGSDQAKYTGYSVKLGNQPVVIHKVTPVVFPLYGEELFSAHMFAIKHYFPYPVIKLDIPDGIYRVPYYEGDSLVNTTIVNYVNGLREGNAIVQYEDGVSTEIYKQGLPVKEYEKSIEKNYRNGLYHGKYITKNDEGVITKELNYVDGFLRGPYHKIEPRFDHDLFDSRDSWQTDGYIRDDTVLPGESWGPRPEYKHVFTNSKYYRDILSIENKRTGYKEVMSFDDRGILDGISYVRLGPETVDLALSRDTVTKINGVDYIIRYYLQGNQVSKQQYDQYLDEVYSTLDELPTVLANMVYDYLVDPITTEVPNIG